MHDVARPRMSELRSKRAGHDDWGKAIRELRLGWDLI
jgi:hypothetical protein